MALVRPPFKEYYDGKSGTDRIGPMEMHPPKPLPPAVFIKCMATLTIKQGIFVKEYLTDGNATRAAKAAGYSEKTADVQGSRLLANVKVRAEIDRQTEKRCEKLDITADYVLSGIRDMVERCRGQKKEFQPFAALKGYELLGKHLKLFTDKAEITGTAGGVILMFGKEQRVQ